MPPRVSKKAKVAPETETKSKSIAAPKSKRAKRPAEDATEANQEVPSKAPRTVLGRAKQQNVVANGLNNNGPLDDQPEVATGPAPSASKARGKKRAASATAVLNDVTPATLYCFGNNDCGQLGLSPDVEKRKFPALVPNLTGKKIIDVACGGMHTLALEENGKVWSFGVNDDKALGRATEEEEDGFEPGIVDLPAGVRAVQITAGDSHSAALTSEGHVYVWGCFKDVNGNFGLVPDDGEICRQKPENITADLGVKITKIASGGHHVAMLAENGKLYTCGTGDQGQLGREQPISRRVTRSMGIDTDAKRAKKDFLLRPSLVKIGRNAKVKDIWTGEFSTYCLAENSGDIYVFGLNNYSQLGIENNSNAKVVISVPTKNTSFKGKQWKQIAAGQHHSIALDEEGKVYSLGRSSDGRLGLGDKSSSKDMFDEPMLVEALAKVKCRRVAAGGSTSYAVTHDGKLYSWGFGVNWQLATGDDEDRDVPSKSYGGRDTDINGEVIRITAGGQHVSLTILSK